MLFSNLMMVGILFLIVFGCFWPLTQKTAPLRRKITGAALGSGVMLILVGGILYHSGLVSVS